MLPTLESGDLIWMRKVRSPELRRFEVVLARTAVGLTTKRIIGLPGERIAMQDGVLFVNGQRIDENPTVRKGFWSISEGTVLPGAYLLMGDNRELPERVVLMVDRAAIIGRHTGSP